MWNVNCWSLTDGTAGAESQCLGLAEALGFPFEAKRVRRASPPFRYLPPSLWPTPLPTGIEEGSGWPDILISSGRGSVAGALAVRRASDKTYTVHIQAPYVHCARFDLIVVPQHDSLRGENVLVTKTALHRVTAKNLADAAQKFGSQFSALPRPLIAVLVGGSSKHLTCSPTTMCRLADSLIAAVTACGGGLAITTSRRTGKQNEEVLRQRLETVPMFFWDGLDPNPYVGLLALSDAIVVTSDSITMVSEACATGKPVHVFNMGETSKKLRQFHKTLSTDGLTRPFAGRIEHWSYEPSNETDKVAAIVRDRFYRSRGLCS
jgi:mitochondrial fission protein ELM1